MTNRTTSEHPRIYNNPSSPNGLDNAIAEIILRQGYIIGTEIVEVFESFSYKRSSSANFLNDRVKSGKFTDNTGLEVEVEYYEGMKIILPSAVGSEIKDANLAAAKARIDEIRAQRRSKN